MDREQRLRTLAELFMQGETSIAEEQELMRLLLRDDVPADLLPLREMMAGLQCIALKEPSHTSRRRLRWWVAAAAAVLLVAGSTMVYYHNAQNVPEHEVIVYGKHYADREMALQEMRQNLTFVAESPTDQVDDLLNDMFDL